MQALGQCPRCVSVHGDRGVTKGLQQGSIDSKLVSSFRMGARAVDRARLESVCTARYRGFESLPIRHPTLELNRFWLRGRVPPSSWILAPLLELPELLLCSDRLSRRIEQMQVLEIKAETD